jgi:hypothetical protein
MGMRGPKAGALEFLKRQTVVKKIHGLAGKVPPFYENPSRGFGLEEASGLFHLFSVPDRDTGQNRGLEEVRGDQTGKGEKPLFQGP